MSATAARSQPAVPGGLRRPEVPPLRRQPPMFLAFDVSGGQRRPPPVACSAVVSPASSTGGIKKSAKRKKPKRSDAAATSTVSTAPDYNQVAAALENLYRLSPPDVEDGVMKIVRSRRKRRGRRAELSKRMEAATTADELEEEGGYEESLVREYNAVAAEVHSMDWRRMKIPPVLGSSEQSRLFKLMQPLKEILKAKENLHKELQQEPSDGQLATALSMTVPQLRKHLNVGRAARNKLIKHNLRLVLFVINKYFPEFANGPKFDDLCQAGVKGLITAIDRFEQKRGFRLSTYGLFWIRHAIIRSMTTSSFTRFPFNIETVRQEIQKAKLQLSFELGRAPTEEEIINRVGISPRRYLDVQSAGKPVFSLNTHHKVTQEELINGVTDEDDVGADKRKPALLRLALDDVLDSLKPKESLVIRQRFGLDGKGERTLGEIAGNLNLSREMVRKHELKGLMKLKHPARVDYLRRYL